MRNNIFLFLFILSCFFSYSQERETVYITINKDSTKVKKSSKIDWDEVLFSQTDLSIPIVLNTNRGEINTDGSTDKNWFLPNGVGVKIGVGLEAFEIIGVSLNTGIDWKINSKMVILPFFGNARLNVNLPNDHQVVLQAGYGKGIALGRGALIGNYIRYNIGYGTIDESIIFLELSGYSFTTQPERNFGSLSIGISMKI